MDLSDQTLIKQIQDSNPIAFDQFFYRYREPIRRHLRQMVRDPVAADDLLQEVFLRVWTKADQWQGQGKVKSWLYRIATNQALNYIRSRSRHPQEPLESPAPSRNEEQKEEHLDSESSWLIDPLALTPEEIVEQAEHNRQLHLLINRLPDPKREVIRLVRQLGLSIQEAAETLDIPPGTVKSRLYYATQDLQQGWRQTWYDDELE